MTKRLTLAAALALLLLLGVLLAGLGTQAIFAQTAPGEGLRADISKVEIPADRRAVVTFRLTDGRGSPLRLEDMDANSVRFVMNRTVRDPETGLTELLAYTVNTVRGASYAVDGQTLQPQLQSASQVVFDSGGSFTSLGNGTYTYKFGFALPQLFDVDATHRVAMQATRMTRKWVANDRFDFRPNGQVPVALDTVTNTACNRCHDLLSAHGGQRYLQELCITCHTKQTIDPESGNTVDYKVMVHKIHRGEFLKTVEAGGVYRIIGNRQSVHDYSEVAFPQDVRNCTTCHTGPAANSWKTKPSAAACGSCHDDIDFRTGANHPAGPATAGSCASCHPADGPEFGPSVAGAHTIPENSSQLAGVTFNLLGVSSTEPGQRPVIAFNVKDKNGNIIDPNKLSRLAFTLAGPTYEYQQYWNESALGAVRQVSADRFEFTFPRALPENADFVWTVQIEGYLNTQLKTASGGTLMGPNNQPLVVRDAGFDKSLDFAVRATTAWPRKTVVTQEQCNACHQRIYFHGGNRQNVDNCVLCHNPTQTDERVRPVTAFPPTSIDLKVILHKIHSGEELTQDSYIIYGRGNVPHEFGDVRYPSERNNCGNCHVPQANYPEFLHTGAQPVVTTQQGRVVSTTPPITAACSGCHDRPEAIAHMRANTAPDGAESCVLCHGEGKSEAVSEVHRIIWPVPEFPR